MSRVFIDDNEYFKRYNIDLFTIDSSSKNSYSFSYTYVYTISSSGIISAADRIVDKYYRTVNAENSRRLLDSRIITLFFHRLLELKDGYDVVIIENIMSTACKIVRLCKGKYDFPIYFHMHNDVDMYRSPAMIRELVRNGVQFIAVSEYIKSKILKYDPKAVVATLYNGIDFSYYDRQAKARIAYCRTNNINAINNKNGNDNKNSDNISECITLLYAGRIIPGKGVKELVKAFLLIQENIGKSAADKIKLNIVGFSSFDKRYEKEIRYLVRNQDNISCIDKVPSDELVSFYDKADVVIMPSLVEESFGLVALETMAKGIPLITTNSGALPEVVGEGGYIVDKTCDFVKNLSRAIEKVAFDNDYRGKLSEQAYKRARSIKAFDINNYYKNFAGILDEFPITPEDKISVIVPVYNVAAYLERCVSSILKQTYDNLEIILVDDGSTDGSGKACDEYSSIDKRVHVIHQENRGLSEARNSGLKVATGKYIFFCDSDDYIESGCLEEMLKRLKREHADVVACGFDTVYDETSSEKVFTIVMDSKPGRWSGRQSVIEMMRSTNVCSVVWNKLYKKELFEGLSFPKGIQNEDEAITYKLLYRAGIVSYTPDTLYNYYQRNNSIMHENLEERFDFFLRSSLDRIKFFSDNNESELVQHSRISLLEWIKYSYRNIHDEKKKRYLLEVYKDTINLKNAPSVMGMKKKMALLAWKYVRY